MAWESRNNSVNLTVIDGHSSSVNSSQMTPIEESILHTVSAVTLYAVMIIGVAGLIGNTLNIIVYIKLGFTETIYMSYVALAVSDIGCILTAMYLGLASFSGVVEAALERHRVKTDMGMFSGFTGSWPYMVLSRTTALLTAWISFERCLCVSLPTRVKLIITPSVTKLVLTIVYGLGCCPAIFVYSGLSIQTKFDPETNYSILMLSHGDYISAKNRLGLYLFTLVYPLLSWTIVAFSTAFLIFKLRKSARWRSANMPANIAIGGDKRERSMYGRENRVTKIVTIVAVTFIVSALPMTVAIFITVFEPKYSLTGSFRFHFTINAGISYVCSQLNSSFNFVIYAFTSSNFRSVLFKMFIKFKCKT